MKRTGLFFASLLLSGAAAAGPEAGDRHFTISGTGASDDSFDRNTFGASGEYGWWRTDRFAWGIRQSASIVAGDQTKDSLSGSTRVFADWHFGDQDVLPYVGANFGGIYGNDAPESLTAGLETGLKLYVKPKTYMQFGVEYQFFFEDASDADDSFDDGGFFYTLGIGYNF